MTYLSIPYVGGNAEAVASIIREANSRCVRMLCIGDSREAHNVSHGGRWTGYQLNRRFFEMFGPASETPVASMKSAWGSGTQPQQYLLNTLQPYSNGTIATDPYLPPSLDTAVRGGTVVWGAVIAQLLPWGVSRSDALKHLSETPELKLDPNVADLVCDVFLKRNAGSNASNIHWTYKPTATATQSTFEATATSGLSSGLNLNSNSNSVVRFTTPALAYNAAKPYAQVSFYGVDAGNAITADALIWGVRYRRTSQNSGVVYQSLAISGSQWEDWIAAIQGTLIAQVNPFQHSGPALALMGTYDMTRFAGGINDYVGKTIDQIEAECRQFISLWRTFLGDSDHQIVLESPYRRLAGIDSSIQNTLNLIAERYYEIAQDTPNVAFFNVSRAMDDAGYSPTNTFWGTDEIHLNQIGDFRKSMIVANFYLGSYNTPVFPTAAYVLPAAGEYGPTGTEFEGEFSLGEYDLTPVFKGTLRPGDEVSDGFNRAIATQDFSSGHVVRVFINNVETEDIELTLTPSAATLGFACTLPDDIELGSLQLRLETSGGTPVGVLAWRVEASTEVSIAVNVTPGVALQTLQQDGSALVAYRGSFSILSLTVLDTTLQPINLNGKTLQLQIGQPGRPVLQTVPNLTATGEHYNVVSFRPEAGVVQMPRTTSWSLYDVTDAEHPEHIVSGVFEVRDALSP